MIQDRGLELSKSKASLRFYLFSGRSTLVCFTQAKLTNIQENLEGQFELRKTFEIDLVSLTKVRLTSVQENQGGRPDAVRSTPDAFGII